MIKSFYFFIVGTFFTLGAIFHFIRLMFEWDIYIGLWSIPSWVSSLVILFAIFMVYFSLKLIKEGKQDGSDKSDE